MISLIICSRTSITDQSLAANIASTIGVAYEIISIDNSANKYSICEAYNIGVEQSRFNILCFMHDDILYHNAKWGANVLQHLNDNTEIGAIGIAGTPHYPFMPGPWWGNGLLYEHILQGSLGSEPTLKSNIPLNEKRQVVAFDGVWFCIKKELFSKIKFDEKSFKGFHLYDCDICMQMHNQGIKMCCINDVLIQHNSIGTPNKTWIDNDLKFQKKWRKTLPSYCIDISYNKLCAYEYKTLNAFMWICAGNGWSNKKIYVHALKYLFKFKKGYKFYKTPGYIIKFAFKLIFKKDLPFYS